MGWGGHDVFHLAPHTGLAHFGRMIEIADINDRDSLKQWLTDWLRDNGKSEDEIRAITVSIAHRAAMRVLPLWWAYTLSKNTGLPNLSALPILRCNLISGVAALVLTPNIKKALAAANAAAVTATNAAASVRGVTSMFAAATASISATATATKTAAVFAAETADFSMAAAASAASSTAMLDGDTDIAALSLAHATDRVNTATAWNELRIDCERIAAGQEIMSALLWSNAKNSFEIEWQAVITAAAAPEWSFWIKWYDDALIGGPQNWKMMEQIALIDPDVWDAGAVAVSGQIDLIEEHNELASEVHDVRKGYEEIQPQVAVLASRFHNNPPELIEAEPLLQTGYEIVWTSLVEAEEELEKDKPSASVLKQLGQSILEACKSIASYCAKLGDAALQKAAEEIGRAGGKWAVRSIAVYLIAQNPGAQSLASRLIEYAEKLAQLP